MKEIAKKHVEKAKKAAEEEKQRNALRPQYYDAQPCSEPINPLAFGLALLGQAVSQSHASSTGGTGSSGGSSSYHTAGSSGVLNPFALNFQPMPTRMSSQGTRSSGSTSDAYFSANSHQQMFN